MTDAAPWLWVDDVTVVAVVDVDVDAAVELAEPELDPPQPANPVESTAAARNEATPSLSGRMQPGFATKWNMVSSTVGATSLHAIRATSRVRGCTTGGCARLDADRPERRTAPDCD